MSITCVEVNPKPPHKVGNVVLRQLRVSAIVYMHSERAQSHPDRVRQHLGTVDAARHPDHAVVRASLPGGLHPTDKLGKRRRPVTPARQR